MRAEQTARKLEEPPQREDPAPTEGVPRAGRALDEMPVHVPVSTGGWLFPILAVALLVSLTVLLLA